MSEEYQLKLSHHQQRRKSKNCNDETFDSIPTKRPSKGKNRNHHKTSNRHRYTEVSLQIDSRKQQFHQDESYRPGSVISSTDEQFKSNRNGVNNNNVNTDSDDQRENDNSIQKIFLSNQIDSFSGSHNSIDSSSSTQMKQSGIKLAMWDYGHCDVKKCSGRKLARLHVIKDLRLSAKWRGIILSPFAKQAVSKADRGIVASLGKYEILTNI